MAHPAPPPPHAVPDFFAAFAGYLADHDVTAERIAKLLGRPVDAVERACRQELTPEVFRAVAQLTHVDPNELMDEVMLRAGSTFRPSLPLHHGPLLVVDRPLPPRRPPRGRADHDRHGRPT